MIAVPIACDLAIMIVEPVVIVMIPILRTLIATILIVMAPAILILPVSRRYAKK
jgi:hypothetical protein